MVWQFVCLEDYNLAKKRNNVVQYEEKKNSKETKAINVGIVVFLVILVYIVGHTAFFLFRERTSVYRVVSDEKNEIINTSGLILRH